MLASVLNGGGNPRSGVYVVKQNETFGVRFHSTASRYNCGTIGAREKNSLFRKINAIPFLYRGRSDAAIGSRRIE